MKKRISYLRILGIGVLIAGLILAAAGCGQKGDGQKGTSQKAGNEPSSVTIGTASVGGTFLVYGGGWAKVLKDALGVNASPEVTGGPVQNIQLVDAGQMDFGMTSVGPDLEAWEGTGWTQGKKYQNIRAIFPTHKGAIQTWSLADSGIKSLSDLDGKRVGMGPKGGTPDAYGLSILKGIGANPSETVNAGYSDLATQMKDKMMPAIFTITGIPYPSIMETEATTKINVFGVTDEEAQKITKVYPFFSKGIIPKGAYKSVTQDIPTLEMWYMMIGRKDLPDDFVYKVVKATFENKQTLVQAHKSAEDTIAEAIVNSTIPVHPGAIKYYEEIGIKIPDKLIPPEYKR